MTILKVDDTEYRSELLYDLTKHKGKVGEHGEKKKEKQKYESNYL